MGGEAAPAVERATGAETLAGMVLEAARRGSDVALRYKDGDDWRDVSYEELGTAAREIAGGLIELGIEVGDRVAIFSETRAEWTLADLGAILAGAVVVPIYQTASSEEAHHVLEDSGSKLVFCENGERIEVARDAAEGTKVGHYVLFEGRSDGAIALDELRERGKEQAGAPVDERLERISPDDVFTLIYTSGTTGPPKGCVLTHANYRADCEMVERTAPIHDGAVVFVFLPLAHALTRVAQMVVLDVGATLAYWERDKEKALDNLKELRPTHFPSVPRIFEKIYEQARKQAGGGIKGKVFDKAVDAGAKVRELERRGEEPGPVLAAEYKLADRQVLSKVRDLFGGNIEFALTGAAPVAKEMLEFFDACGVLVLEGYGSTETSAVATVNSPDDFKFGTVGKALPGSEVKIADDRDDQGRGEILVKGPHVFQGYYGLEEETREALDDGWFKSGDIGAIDDEGFVTVSGRTKEIIVTSSGKNITPTNIEQKLADSPAVSQAVVYGDDRPYLVALIEVDEDNVDGDADELVQKAVDEANADLAKIEQVKKFTILERPLGQEEGELTPTLKVKREVVYEHFEEEIGRLYEDDGDSD